MNLRLMKIRGTGSAAVSIVHMKNNENKIVYYSVSN